MNIKGNKSVYVVGWGLEYRNMFHTREFQITEDLTQADLVQFTGGEDVTPAIYNQAKHSTTNCNPKRDSRENLVFQYCYQRNIPMVGICRGGQFLNIMCGGDMWQDVDGHGATHDVIDECYGDVVKASSTHHQMMIPHEDAAILMTASESTRREKFNKQVVINKNQKEPFKDDIEALYYDDEKVLCFQPHPEYAEFWELRKLYFRFIDEFLLDEGK